MSGALLVAIGAAMWVVGFAFGDVVGFAASLVFIFVGGLCIGSGMVKAVQS